MTPRAAAGPAVVGLDVADAADAWRTAGFAVGDDGRMRIGQVVVHTGGPGRGITGWVLAGISATTTAVDGLPTRAGDPATAVGAVPSEHPNGATVVDHVVVFTPDGPRTVGALEALGLPVRRVREDTRTGTALRQTFLRAGEVIVEVVTPVDPPADRDSPATFYGIACAVRDLDACARSLGDALTPVRDAVQPGRRIATVRRHATGLRTALALMSA